MTQQDTQPPAETLTERANSLPWTYAEITTAIRVAREGADQRLDVRWWALEEISRVELILAALTRRAGGDAIPAGEGFVFWNPDSGEEYAPTHPVRSGECVEAERIRLSTPQEDTLWRALQEQFVRAEALATTSAPTANSAGDTGVGLQSLVADVLNAAWALCDDTENGDSDQPSVSHEAWKRLADALDALEAVIPKNERPCWPGVAARLLASTPKPPAGGDAGIDAAVERMRDDPFGDDAHLLGTTAQDARMRHYATIALAPPRPDYKAAWRRYHDALSWMQGNPDLTRYLGWDLVDIANDLIDRAYPGLREGCAPWPATPVGNLAADGEGRTDA